MFYLDILVIFILAAAVATGLWILNRHHAFFAEFKLRDLFSLRTDALLYLLLVTSTSICCVDVFLRYIWMQEICLSSTEPRWAVLWQCMHLFYAAITALLHLLIGKLLRNEQFCHLCRRGL